MRKTQHAKTAFDARTFLSSDQGAGEARPFPYLAYLPNYPPPHLLHLLPYELACRYQCVPLGAERRVLTLATCRWLNHEIVAHLRSATRRGIFQVRCERATLDDVLSYWQHLQHEAGVNEVCQSLR